jgi:putative peptide zinc metalloprotease protein
MLLENPVEAPPLSGPRRVHRLAEGTELLGEYQGSGFQDPKFLIRRSDGQVMHVPALLYRVASSLDGRHDDAALAAAVAGELDRQLTAEQFSFLVEEKLRPAGVVAPDDDSAEEPPPVKADPLLALRFRVGVVPERTVWRLATPLRFLFRRPAWVTAVAALLALDAAILVQGNFLDRVLRGIEVVIRHPGLVLALLVLEMVALIFHEIGHVTACRYGGARPGAMGIGLYLIWPAYYSTVTDSYRLDRVGRLRTDLGGVYFNAVFMAVVGAVYLQTGEPWLLLALIALHTETIWQFLPSIRLDGYYILADLAGVPELFGYILPALRSLVPGRPAHPRLRELRPWPRRVIVGWVAATIPTLLFYLVAFLLVMPHALPVAVRELRNYGQTLEQAVRTGQVVQSTLGVFQGFLLVLPWIGTAMITVTTLGMLRRAAVARWGRGRVRSGTWARVHRVAALSGVGSLAVLLVLRIWQVGTSLPASPAEVRLVNGAIDAVTRGSALDGLRPGELMRQHLAAYAWLTGAFRRHPDVLDGSREMAVLSVAVLVTCLLVFAARRRVRLMAITLPLLAALVTGPAVSTLAAVTAALVGSAWTAAGLLVLTRPRHQHRRHRGRIVTAVGAAAVFVGVAVCPLLLRLAGGLALGGRDPAARRPRIRRRAFTPRDRRTAPGGRPHRPAPGRRSGRRRRMCHSSAPSLGGGGGRRGHPRRPALARRRGGAPARRGDGRASRRPDRGRIRRRHRRRASAPSPPGRSRRARPDAHGGGCTVRAPACTHAAAYRARRVDDHASGADGPAGRARRAVGRPRA